MLYVYQMTVKDPILNYFKVVFNRLLSMRGQRLENACIDLLNDNI